MSLISFLQSSASNSFSILMPKWTEFRVLFSHYNFWSYLLSWLLSYTPTTPQLAPTQISTEFLTQTQNYPLEVHTWMSHSNSHLVRKTSKSEILIPAPQTCSSPTSPQVRKCHFQTPSSSRSWIWESFFTIPALLHSSPLLPKEAWVFSQCLHFLWFHWFLLIEVPKYSSNLYTSQLPHHCANLQSPVCPP